MPEENYFPPEWAQQSAVMLAWPYGTGDFSPWLDETEKTYSAIAKAVTDHEPLIVLCQSHEHQRHIENQLETARVTREQVRFLDIPYNDVWVRDTAPLSVQALGAPRLLNFRFNGWGNKYDHTLDAQLGSQLQELGLFPHAVMEHVDFVLEGGSLETDGAGTILTTSRCLLNANRNPQLSKGEIEKRLMAYFGLKRILWLEHGHAEGDDTDAHVDTLARYCDANTIAYTACDDETDPLFQELKAMAEELAKFTDCNGAAYKLVPLPIPRPIFDSEGFRLPATYANFLIINGAVLLPVYQDPADQIAISRLATCFPDRDILPIYATPLIRQYGSIHCMTMQFPQFVSVSL
jgi:agmatine/peptidylarginine deiminase